MSITVGTRLSTDPGNTLTFGTDGGVRCAETILLIAAAGSARTITAPPAVTLTRLTLTQGTCALTFPTATVGVAFTVAVAQDVTGGRTVTWPGAVKWPGGSAPTLTVAPFKVDVFSFLCVDAGTWWGFLGGKGY